MFRGGTSRALLIAMDSTFLGGMELDCKWHHCSNTLQDRPYNLTDPVDLGKYLARKVPGKLSSNQLGIYVQVYKGYLHNV